VCGGAVRSTLVLLDVFRETLAQTCNRACYPLCAQSLSVLQNKYTAALQPVDTPFPPFPPVPHPHASVTSNQHSLVKFAAASAL
jgi:hypothetical protein